MFKFCWQVIFLQLNKILQFNAFIQLQFGVIFIKFQKFPQSLMLHIFKAIFAVFRLFFVLFGI